MSNMESHKLLNEVSVVKHSRTHLMNFCLCLFLERSVAVFGHFT